MWRIWLILVLVFGLGTSALGAQSLADAAKKERERQQKAKSDAKANGKVITERDLRGRGGRTARSQAASDGVSTARGNKAAAPSDRSETGSQRDLSGHDEAYWRQRKQSLQDELQKTEQRLKELNDFLDRNHAVYTLQSLASVKNERDQVTRKAEDIRQKIQGLDEEARKAGAPPAWVR